MLEENINKRLDQQAEILQKLVVQNQKNERILNWIRVLAILRVVVIAAPIILGIIYLPSFVRNILPDLQNIQQSALDIGL